MCVCMQCSNLEKPIRKDFKHKPDFFYPPKDMMGFAPDRLTEMS